LGVGLESPIEKAAFFKGLIHLFDSPRLHHTASSLTVPTIGCARDAIGIRELAFGAESIHPVP
jgi:hypothetical protein